MSNIAHQLSKTSNLLRALEAATHWPALATLLGILIVFTVLMALGAATGSETFMKVLLLVGLLEILIGFSATGHLLMDQARGIPSRSAMDAVLAAVFSLHRLLGVIVLAILAFVIVLAVVAIFLLLCKIPGLGPVLYAVVFPIASALLGVAMLALFYVGPSILLPAVWEGQGVVAAMARLWIIVRRNLLLAVLSLLLLSLVLGVLISVIWLMALAGSLTTTGLATAVIGYEVGSGLMGMISNLMMTFSGYGGTGNGYVTATLFGAMGLYSVAFSIPALVGLSGICHIYLQSSDGLDFQEAETRINQGVAEAKRRALEAQARAQQAAQEAAKKARAANTARADQASAAPAVPTCPACQGNVTDGDVFCGNCGHRLQG